MWSGGLVSSGISDIEKRFVEGESKISSGSIYLYGGMKQPTRVIPNLRWSVIGVWTG